MGQLPKWKAASRFTFLANGICNLIGAKGSSSTLIASLCAAIKMKNRIFCTRRKILFLASIQGHRKM